MTADNLNGPATEPVQATPDVTPAPEPAQPKEAQKPGSFSEWLDDYEAKQNQPEITEPEQDVIPAEVPPAAPQEPAPEPLIMGKFKTQADLENAYQEAQRKISELGQTNSLTAQGMQQMRNELSQVREFMTKQQQPPKPEEPKFTPEQEQELFTSLYNSENPISEMMKILQPVIQGQVKPLQEKLQAYESERQWQAQVSEAASKFSDFQEMVPEVMAIIQEKPYLAQLPGAVEEAYNLAKARQVLSQPKPPTMGEMLNNPEFIKSITQNETVRREILKGHAQQVQQNQPPPVIGKQAGGLPPSTPRESIKTVGDATKAFKAHMDRLFGGGPQ